MIDLTTWQKAWALLDPRERRTAWMVLGVIVIAALSAALMVGSVMPFLAVLAEPSRIQDTAVLHWAYNAFGFDTTYGFLIGLGLLSFTVIAVASAIQFAKTWMVARFAWMRMHSLSHRMLGGFLAQPYAFFLNRHSGEMGPRVLSEPLQVVHKFYRPAAELIAASFTVVAIVLMLLWVEPVVAVVSFVVLGGIYAVVYRSTRYHLLALGRTTVAAERERFRMTNESFAGIKDIKLLGRERAYLDRYAAPSLRQANAEVKVTVLAQVPQFALQAVALGGVILMCLLLIDPATVASGASLGGILPVLGVFAFAGQRMMPELSKIYASLAQIQAGAAAVDSLHADLMSNMLRGALPTSDVEALGMRENLVLDGISYAYPKSGAVSIDGITLSIRAGEKIGIVGTTGAGKTTLVDIILGLLEPYRGKLIADGQPIDGSKLRAWMKSVGYVPQEIFLVDASVAENIALGAKPEEIDHELVRRSAEIARIDQFITTELPEDYQTHIGERGVRLSGGQRQRLGIARALYHDADLIVFDEATSALDNLTEHEVMEAIRSLPGNKTLLMIAHRLSTIQTCDRIVVLDRGKLVGCDTWDALMAGNPVFQRIAQLSERA